jgi:phosphopantothenoylcysteine decarboxylase/phosphopantothenate--cysteine ligase
MRGRDWDVTVIMTKAATEFIGEVTLRTLSRNPVAVEMFPDSDEWIPGHISLADRADALVIAPCTANVIAKLARGLADDLLSCTALACTAPLIVAPAMNEKMLDHPATAENLGILKKRGAMIIAGGPGELACGCQGRGRMAEPEKIVDAVVKALGHCSRGPASKERRSS